MPALAALEAKEKVSSTHVYLVFLPRPLIVCPSINKVNQPLSHKHKRVGKNKWKKREKKKRKEYNFIFKTINSLKTWAHLPRP